VLAVGFAAEDRLFADGWGAPTALRPHLDGMGAAQVDGELAVLAREEIDGPVELPEFSVLRGSSKREYSSTGR
jgi:hypothetical protein